MDALKWIIKISFILAMIFLGLKTKPNPDHDKQDKPDKQAVVSILSTFR